MAGTNIWAEIGIAPTTDTTAIRRAYAARLKIVRPETDPQGFARLRAAYERALQASDASTTAAPPVRPSSGPLPDVPATPARPLPAEFTVVADCIQRRDVVAAATQLAAARAAGGLSLEHDLRLADQLGWTMAEDSALPAAEVRAAAELLGWLRGEVTGPWVGTLRKRLDAEYWLASLRRDAASRWVWVGAVTALSARILLGRGKLRTVPAMGRDPTLRRRYGEFLLHAGVIGDRFDPVRIESVGKLLTGQPDKPGSVALRVLGTLLIAGIMGKAVGEVAPGYDEAVAGTTAFGLFLTLYIRGKMRRVPPRRG